jgi:hypothetical protein
MKSPTPRQLDWLCNGVPVYIRRRPSDGKVYATTADFSRFIREEPLETLRISFASIDDIRNWEPEADERVKKAMAKYR